MKHLNEKERQVIGKKVVDLLNKEAINQNFDMAEVLPIMRDLLRSFEATVIVMRIAKRLEIDFRFLGDIVQEEEIKYHNSRQDQKFSDNTKAVDNIVNEIYKRMERKNDESNNSGRP